MATGFILGSVLIGMLADRLSRRGVSMLAVMKASMGVTLAMFALMTAGQVDWVLPVLFVYAFCAPGGVVVYAILSRHFPGHLSGRVNTAVNMLAFLGGFTVQWGMGVIIGIWPAEAGHYSPSGYLAAFGMMLALQFAVFVWVLPLREEGVAPPAPEEARRERD